MKNYIMAGITIVINLLLILFIILSYTIDLTIKLSLLDVIIIVLVVGYFDYIVYEKIITSIRRASFKYVIHVNGIRGKSTTTRLIDAGIRNCGYKVFSKTTGTIPTIINTKNEEVKIHRLGNANIREQIKMVKRAYKEQADVLVLECMAVNPELQYICERQILEANITVITNVRPDHIQDMGETLDDLAVAFCNTIPKEGHLIINDGDYSKLFSEKAKELKTECHIAKEYKGSDTLDTFEENIALALEVANVMNLDVDLFFEGMRNYHHDFGAFSEALINNTIFLNGFSINDPVSIKKVYEKILNKYDANKITILLNSRSDRPTRVIQHIELLKELPCKKILISGSNPKYVKNKLQKDINTELDILDKITDINNEEIVFAIGNIGGKGMDIIKYIQTNGATK